jgi:hypothetical protein
MLHVLNHPFAHPRFQKSLKPSWFWVVAQHHVLQFPLSAKTCSIRTAGTSTDRCMISRLSCSVRSTGARSKSHEAQSHTAASGAPLRSAGGHWVGFGCHEVSEEWRTDSHSSLTLCNIRSEKERTAGEMPFPYRHASMAVLGMGRYVFLPYVHMIAASGQAVLTPRQLQMTGVCATALRKRLGKSKPVVPIPAGVAVLGRTSVSESLGKRGYLCS